MTSAHPIPRSALDAAARLAAKAEAMPAHRDWLERTADELDARMARNSIMKREWRGE